MFFIFGLIGYYLRRKKWRRIAGELGLELAERGLDMSGEWKGRRVRIRIYDRNAHLMSTGTDYRTSVATSLLEPLPWKLGIRKQGLGAAAEKLLGGQDLTTGDPQADSALMIQSDDEERTLRLLDGQLRRTLVEAVGEVSSLELHEAGVSAERMRRLSSAETFRSMLGVQAGVAAAVERSLAMQPDLVGGQAPTE